MCLAIVGSCPGLCLFPFISSPIPSRSLTFTPRDITSKEREKIDNFIPEMATRANPPKKVRLACRRCRTRRIKVRLSHDPRPALWLQSDQIPRWGLVLLAWTMTGTIAALLRLKLFGLLILNFSVRRRSPCLHELLV